MTALGIVALAAGVIFFVLVMLAIEYSGAGWD